MVERVRGRDDGALCLSRRHGGVPSSTLPGLTVCAVCRDDAEENLLELPVLYEMCAYVLDVRHPQPRERVSGRRPGGIVLRDAVVGIRSEILGVLASWCGLVASERRVSSPDELSIPRLSTFVLIHFSWLTAHPAGPDFTDELAELTDRAREVLKPEPRAEMDLGPCTRPRCRGTVRAEGHPPARIRCDSGHEWPPEKWLLLRDEQHRLDTFRERGE